MGRRFTRASSEYARVTMGPSEGETFDAYTVVAVFNLAQQGIYQWLIAAQTSGAAANRIAFGLDSTNHPAVYEEGSSDSYYATSTMTVTTSDGWVALAFTKTAGTTTPRVHKYVFNTNTWTHEDVGGTQPATVSTGSGGIWVLGMYLAVDANHLDATYAAAAHFTRSFTDGECKSLARGRLSEQCPKFHVEFPSGIDRPDRSIRDLAHGQRQSVISGTTRGALRDPPGFRFSINNRRR